MKITTKIILSIMALIAITIVSCKKDRIEKKQKNEYNDINDYFNDKKQEEQEFEITGPSNDTIQGNQGTRIAGAKNCLQDNNGDTVDYPYTIKLIELYTQKDMIYYQMPTVSNGKILESDGEIRLRAFKGTQELTLKPSCPYYIEMPNNNPQSYMTVFNGVDNGTFVDWVNTSAPFTLIPYGYSAFVNTLGWINVDNTIGLGQGNILTFTSKTDDLTNVGIFISFTAIDGVMQVYNQASGLIPNGSVVKIVLIGVNSSGDLYSYTENRTVNSSASIDVVLTQTTDPVLTSYLDNL